MNDRALPAPLFTPRFLVMCAFSFTVFLSAFQLLPTAPYRILALGGSESSAGLFLGFLTYASAASAPFTGVLVDRFGRRRTMIVSSLVIAFFAIPYGLSRTYQVPLALAVVHGVFWSGLLSGSAAYVTDIIPPARRAEGISYWGLSHIFAIAVAPRLGFWIYEQSWTWLCVVTGALNVLMTLIAWSLPESPHAPEAYGPLLSREHLDLRVLAVAVTLFLYSFGYGGITSFVALYADANQVAPRTLYFTALAVVMVATRPLLGRMGDRVGHRTVLLPCLVLITVGLALLAWQGTRPWLLASALVFGVGFGTAYPLFTAYVMEHVDASRRGAAFGAILAAFDTGIGSGSITAGILIDRYGFNVAYGVAAALAALSLPYFLMADRRFVRSPSQPQGTEGASGGP